MKPEAYPTLVEGRGGWCEWVTPGNKGFHLACCTCNLTHELQFRVVNGHVQFRGRQRPRSTAALRREARKKRGR